MQIPNKFILTPFILTVTTSLSEWIENICPKPSNNESKSAAILETFFTMASRIKKLLYWLTALVLHFFNDNTNSLTHLFPINEGYVPCVISPARGYVFQSFKIGRDPFHLCINHPRLREQYIRTNRNRQCTQELKKLFNTA